MANDEFDWPNYFILKDKMQSMSEKTKFKRPGDVSHYRLMGEESDVDQVIGMIGEEEDAEPIRLAEDGEVIRVPTPSERQARILAAVEKHRFRKPLGRVSIRRLWFLLRYAWWNPFRRRISIPEAINALAEAEDTPPPQ